MLGSIVPILRMFDERKARGFYLEFLGFRVEFEHSFGDNFPLYLGLVRDNCRLHLSAHHGDASPGTHIRIHAGDVAELANTLRKSDYRYSKPGQPKLEPWGEQTLTIADPFGNRLTFVQTPSPPQTRIGP